MIPICIVAYNRLGSLQRLLESLEKADYPGRDILLIISIDKSDTSVVEEFSLAYEWPHGSKRVITHDHNLGLRKHVLSCGDLLEEFESIILLEDDDFVAPAFYNYACACVEKYNNDDRIAGISLYSFAFYETVMLPFNPVKGDSDTFLMQYAQSRGEIWMRKSWQKFKSWYDSLTEELLPSPSIPKYVTAWSKNSWLKYHIAYCIEKNLFFVYPYYGFCTCFAEDGVHTGGMVPYFQSQMFYGEKTSFNLNAEIKYDSYFEFIGLGKYLGIDEKDLCTDFFGVKKNQLNRRYWLSRSVQPFKCIKSFALQLRPYELNVINNISGNELFLYDTFHKAESPKSDLPEYSFDLYTYNRRIDLKWQFRRAVASCIKKVFKLAKHQ